jgi:hypothetical protein
MMIPALNGAPTVKTASEPPRLMPDRCKKVVW